MLYVFIIQATTLGDFPAPMSLCAITSMIGVIITAMVQLVEYHDLQWGWPLLSVTDLIGFSILVCNSDPFFFFSVLSHIL